MNHFKTKSEFESFMREIDTILKAKNIPIPNRPLYAFREIAVRLHINLPITSTGQPIPSVYHGVSLSAHIHKWFEDLYGDRLKIDFSPAYVVLSIDNDPYRLKIPRVYGKCKFVFDKTFKKRANIFVNTTDNKKGLEINLCELIQDITKKKINSLSVDDQKKIMIFSANTFNTIYKLEKIELPFKNEALKDLGSAVKFILSYRDSFDQSKWFSLQFTEKVMKGMLKKRGIDFKKNHNLSELNRKLINNNLNIIPDVIISKIQCSAGVRYGEIDVTQKEAVEAHHASLFALKCLLKDIPDHVDLNR